MFRFAEGDVVALTEDYPGLGLSAGDTGVIWVRYSTTPPAYDVTFCAGDGGKFDMVLDEGELMEPAQTREAAGTVGSTAHVGSRSH